MLLEPDRNQIEVFTEALFRHAGNEGYVSLRLFLEGDDREAYSIIGVPLVAGFPALCERATSMAGKAAAEPRSAVFAPPIAVFNCRDRARELDLLCGPVLSVECDKHPQRAQQMIEAVLGPATVVVRSGGKWANGNGENEDKRHLHWRLNNPATDKESFAKLKRARELATRIADGDHSCIPIVHPMRWPGSWHRKAEPRMCTIEACNPDIEIDLNDALVKLKAAGGGEKPEPTPREDGGDNTWEKLIGGILNGERYHPSVVPLTAKLRIAGLNEGTIVNLTRGLLKNSAGPRDDRWWARYNAVPSTVRSAWNKFKAPSTALFDPWAEYIVPPFPLDILPWSPESS
jgi:hypothetical protein